jgi:hypothetical protein
MAEHEKLQKILEDFGEEAVRLRNAQHDFGGPGTSGYAFVSEWLRKLEAERASREAFDAKQIAQRANTIAIIAMIVAMIALLYDFFRK